MTIVTKTTDCACGGKISYVVPAEDATMTEAHEMQEAVVRHNRTPAHKAMSERWAGEWLHPYDEGYPHEEVMRDE